MQNAVKSLPLLIMIHKFLHRWNIQMSGVILAAAEAVDSPRIFGNDLASQRTLSMDAFS